MARQTLNSVKIQLVFQGLVSVSGSTLENSCNKPAFLCLLWENPQTPQRHWSLAGRGRRASPRRPGCRNQGRESCLHGSVWWRRRRQRVFGAFMGDRPVDEAMEGDVVVRMVSRGVRTCRGWWWEDGPTVVPSYIQQSPEAESIG